MSRKRYAQIIHALTEEITIDQIVNDFKVDEQCVRKMIRELSKLGAVRIASWITATRHYIPVYTIGKGESAPRPESRQSIRKEKSIRRAKLNLEKQKSPPKPPSVPRPKKVIVEKKTETLVVKEEPVSYGWGNIDILRPLI
jgi:hypothetical protein